MFTDELLNFSNKDVKNVSVLKIVIAVRDIIPYKIKKFEVKSIRLLLNKNIVKSLTLYGIKQFLIKY